MQAQRGVEGETVAAALRWRGCGCAWASEREEAEERNEGEGEGEGVPGVALASSRRDEGEPGRLGGRRWPGRVRACVGHTRVLLAEEEEDKGGGGGLGRPDGLASCWAAGGLPGKLR